jgi:hypothetical protein
MGCCPYISHLQSFSTDIMGDTPAGVPLSSPVAEQNSLRHLRYCQPTYLKHPHYLLPKLPCVILFEYPFRLHPPSPVFCRNVGFFCQLTSVFYG